MHADTNPYQSPQPPAPLATVSRDRLAETARLLIKRRDDAEGVGFYLRRIWRRELALHTFVALCVWLLVTLEYPWPAALLAAMILTRSFRDLVWYRMFARQWPVTRELLDWEKVERLAREEEVV